MNHSKINLAYPVVISPKFCFTWYYFTGCFALLFVWNIPGKKKKAGRDCRPLDKLDHTCHARSKIPSYKTTQTIVNLTSLKVCFPRWKTCFDLTCMKRGGVKMLMLVIEVNTQKYETSLTKVIFLKILFFSFSFVWERQKSID